MSKERLAKMNKKVVGLTDGEDFSDLVQMDVDTYAWFYKQAERALKNADDLHVMDLQLASEQKSIKRLQDENEALSSANQDLLHEVRVLRNKVDQSKEYEDFVFHHNVDVDVEMRKLHEKNRRYLGEINVLSDVV